MQLHVEHRPRSRGVSQLMYVGDDADTTVEGPFGPTNVRRASYAAFAYGALGPKKHRTVALVTGILLQVMLRSTV